MSAAVQRSIGRLAAKSASVPVPWVSQYLTADDGCPLHVNLVFPEGSPSTSLGKHPLVFIHGLTTNSTCFAATLRNVQHAHGAICLDVRGRGNSYRADPAHEAYFEKYTAHEQHVKDVTAVLDHFNIDKGILVGHSNGAFVALLAALRIPSRLLGVMLLDGGFPRDPKNEKLDEATAAGVARAKTKLAQAFSSLDAYIEFQNPAKGLTAATIHPDILAMYKYELQQCEDGLRVKVCPRCVEMDMTALVTRFLTAEQMAAVTVPVGMVVAEHGFADNLPPMMRKDHVDDMRKALQPKVLDYVQGANHYTLLMDDRFVPQTAASIEKFVNIVLPDYA